MPTVDPPFFNEDQIRSVLTYAELIPAMRRALGDFSAGQVLQPVRSVIPVPAYNGWFAIMPAVHRGVMGAKMVTFYPGNTAFNKPTHLATNQLFRADTGEALAVMDGRLITEMRTAAVTALAVDLLARPGASTLAILGSGVQARSHFRAFAGIRDFRHIRVWSRSPDHARAFASEIGARTTATAQQAVKDADVVLTLTSSPVPILQGKWLKQDAVVCAIGAVTPDRRELDDEAVRGPIIVESREAAAREPGDILIANARVTAELGELINGVPCPLLEQRTAPIVYKSVGIAIEDIAAAKLVYDRLAHH
jgi:ornithine cyclodeaminase/alanine dehydrogenase-like protein (mu-crystallin family)